MAQKIGIFYMSAELKESKKKKQAPHKGEKSLERAKAQQDRRAAALRENLLRRKAWQRGIKSQDQESTS